jgi:hypothetical protein
MPSGFRSHLLFYLSVSLLLLSKQTTIPATIILFFIRKYSGRLKRQTDFLPSFALLPALIWYIQFFISRSETSIIRGVFEAGLPAGYLNIKLFLTVWLADAMDLTALGISGPKPSVFITGILLLLPFSLLALWRHYRMRPIVILTTIFLWVVAGMMYSLNKWVPGVNWYAYRHFNIYGIFFFTGLLGWILGPAEQLFRREFKL